MIGSSRSQTAPPFAEATGHVQTACCNAMHYTVPYSVTAGCALIGNARRLALKTYSWEYALVLC